MVHSRWQIVFISFLAGILVGLFLAYSFAGTRKEEIWTRQEHGPAVTKNVLVPLIQQKKPPPPPPPPKKKDAEEAPKKPKEKPKAQASSSTAIKQVPAYAAKLASATYTQVEDGYYNRLDGVHVKCDHTPHIGRGGDGGWEVCMVPAFKPKKPCLVYSFGVNNIWEFDESMARDYGCVVRAFDPSMSANDHVHQPGPVNFYKIGLGGSNRRLSNGWQLFTFQSLLTKYGEAERTLDLVKIDIEYSEWESFESMIATGVLQRTKQLLFETHTNDLNNAITSKDNYLRYHKILDAIEGLGFRRFFRHDNQFGIGPVTGSRSRSNDPIYRKSADLRRTCCHELYYVNMNFAKDMSGLTVY